MYIYVCYPGLNFSIMFIQFTQFVATTRAVHLIANLGCCCNYGHEKQIGGIVAKTEIEIKVFI